MQQSKYAHGLDDVVDALRALKAGYEAEKSMYDDDMIGHAETVCGQYPDALLAYLEGDAPDKRQAMLDFAGEHGAMILDLESLPTEPLAIVSKRGAMALARKFLGTCRTTMKPAPIEFAAELRDALADLVDECVADGAHHPVLDRARDLLGRIRDAGM